MAFRPDVKALAAVFGCALVACARDAPVTHGNDAAALAPIIHDAAATIDADAEPELAAAPPPAVCTDGGPTAFYVVGEGGTCPAPATLLEWIASDGVHRAAADGSNAVVDATDDDSMLGTLRFISDLPTCLGPHVVVSEVKKLRSGAHGETVYRVALDGHDNGGMECHAGYERHVAGEVVVDGQGLLVKADLRGEETVVGDDKPNCRYLYKTTPWNFRVRRACSAP